MPFPHLSALPSKCLAHCAMGATELLCLVRVSKSYSMEEMRERQRLDFLQCTAKILGAAHVLSQIVQQDKRFENVGQRQAQQQPRAGGSVHHPCDWETARLVPLLQRWSWVGGAWAATGVFALDLHGRSLLAFKGDGRKSPS